MDRHLCKTVRQQLEGLASATLPAAEREALEAHIQACDSCHTLVRRSRRLTSLLGSLSRKSAPVDFLDRVWDRVLAEDERSGLTRRLARSVASLPRSKAPEVEVEDPRLVGVLQSLPTLPAPAALDRAVRSRVRDFVWSSSRPARIFRLVAGGMAAAASLLLCLTLWAGGEDHGPSRPRFVYRDVSAPLAGWSTHESDGVVLDPTATEPKGGAR